MILVNIQALGIAEYVLLDKVTHAYESGTHTMTIETLTL